MGKDYTICTLNITLTGNRTICRQTNSRSVKSRIG